LAEYPRSRRFCGVQIIRFLSESRSDKTKKLFWYFPWHYWLLVTIGASLPSDFIRFFKKREITTSVLSAEKDDKPLETLKGYLRCKCAVILLVRAWHEGPDEDKSHWIVVLRYNEAGFFEVYDPGAEIRTCISGETGNEIRFPEELLAQWETPRILFGNWFGFRQRMFIPIPMSVNIG
jgi:hypothetical protein